MMSRRTLIKLTRPRFAQLRYRHHAASSPNVFDTDTEIFQTAAQNKFTAEVTRNWSVGDAPNGGYLMAVAISAARKVINFRDPLTMTAYYTNKALEGQPVDIEVETLNATKGTATVSVSFKQGGSLRSQYIGTFGTLSSMKGLNYSDNRAAPVLPPPEDCVDCSAQLRKHMGDNLQVAKRVEFRCPESDPFVQGTLLGKPVQEASLSCWVRFADDREPCLRSMAFFLDALPPPILALAKSNWVPTLEYTVHFWQRVNTAKRGLPVSDGHHHHKQHAHEHPYWLRCKYTTPFAINGMLYTDAELWSEDGSALLATARQIARVLTPR